MSKQQPFQRVPTYRANRIGVHGFGPKPEKPTSHGYIIKLPGQPPISLTDEGAKRLRDELEREMRKRGQWHD